MVIPGIGQYGSFTEREGNRVSMLQPQGMEYWQGPASVDQPSGGPISDFIAQARGGEPPPACRGTGSCYVEFGEERVGRVDIEFLAGPPRGSFQEPSAALVAEKLHFGTSRRTRWFGLEEGSETVAFMLAPHSQQSPQVR
jgi:hypothetical protein